MRISLAGTVVTAVFGAMLVIQGCSPKTESPSVTTTSEGEKSQAPSGVKAAKENVALVRFVNADPRSKLDVTTAKDPLFSGVEYKKVTEYVETARGYAQFKVMPPGNPKELASARRELFPGRHYTIIAFPEKKGAGVVLSFSDNLGKIEPGGVRARLINATSDMPDLELYFAGEPKPLLRGIDAGKIVSFVDMEPGTVEIRTAKGKPYPNFGDIKVEANRLYTFIAVGDSKAPDLLRIEDRVEEIGEP
jgi:hypothetical protein